MKSLEHRKFNQRLERWDPEVRVEFAGIIIWLADEYLADSTIASTFSCSITTVKRWKTGAASPILLARCAIKKHLLENSYDIIMRNL